MPKSMLTARIISTLGIGILALFMAFSAVYAEDSSEAPEVGPQPSTPIQMTVPLTLDCSSVPKTAAAIEEVTRGDLCGESAKSAPGSVAAQDSIAQDTIVGDCGTLTLTLYNEDHGWVGTHTIITSFLGPMVHASYSGYVQNLNTGGSHSFGGSGHLFGSIWSHNQSRYTGPGWVRGEIVTATSTLAWGGQCHGSGATDITIVT